MPVHYCVSLQHTVNNRQRPASMPSAQHTPVCAGAYSKPWRAAMARVQQASWHRCRNRQPHATPSNDYRQTPWGAPQTPSKRHQGASANEAPRWTIPKHQFPKPTPDGVQPIQHPQADVQDIKGVYAVTKPIN